MADVKQKARHFAQLVLEKFWDGVIPVDPVAIARKLGIPTVDHALPQDISGALVKTETMSYPMILVEKSEPDVRKRFTIAHELGHYIYNTMILALYNYKKIDCRSTRPEVMREKEEVFANNFAASLLMPESYLKELNLPDLNARIATAKALNVSLESFSYRYNSFNLSE